MREYTMIRVDEKTWIKELRENLNFAVDAMVERSTPDSGTDEEIFQARRKWTNLRAEIQIYNKWEFKDSKSFLYCIVLSPDSLVLLDKAVRIAYEESMLRAANVLDSYKRDEAISKRQYARARTLRMLHDEDNTETFEYSENGDLNSAVIAAAQKAGWGELRNNSKIKESPTAK